MILDDSIVHIVDDDPVTLHALSWLVAEQGLQVQSYICGELFLETYSCKGYPECLLLDMGMPGLSGSDVQKQMQQQNIHLPIIFLTASANIIQAVNAMKFGAVDFLVKPYDKDDLLPVLEKALQISQRQMAEREKWEAVSGKMATLTPREREVMEQVVQGKMNKVISQDLGIGEKTVEIHRSRLMRKLEVRSVAALVRLWLSCQQAESLV